MVLSASSLAARRWSARLDRGVLSIAGKDARKLLQGLVTSDLTELDAAPQYTAFLSAPGRVLHDAFLVSAPEGGVLVDVERSALADVAAHVRKYKLRSKVTIVDASADFEVLATAGEACEEAGGGGAPACEGGGWRDPRLEYLGERALLPRGASAPAAEVGAEVYDLQLALLGVPNGAAHLPPGEALPLEANLELLQGVSFTKGCYLGQELTARTNFRGVVRKRLLPLVSADAAAAAAAGGAEPAGPAAFAHLPAAERRLAAALLGGTADAAAVGAAAGAHGDALSAGASLRGAGGKGRALASVRSYEPAWGVGMGLCRLTALGGGPLVDEDGAPSLAPHRPSWWPPHVGADPEASQ